MTTTTMTRTAIRTVTEWHGGQFCPLYSILSTGRPYSFAVASEALYVVARLVRELVRKAGGTESTTGEYRGGRVSRGDYNRLSKRNRLDVQRLLSLRRELIGAIKSARRSPIRLTMVPA